MVLKNIIGVSAILITFILLFSPPLFSSELEYISQKEIIENSAACLDCHEDIVRSLSESAHQIFDINSGSEMKGGCVGCHDGWVAHLEDPGKDNIGQPKNSSPGDQSKICARCHQSLHQTSMNSFDPHGLNGMTCLDCHKVHDNQNELLLTNNRQEFCLSCHSEVAADFKSRSAHPYDSGNINCVDCHVMGEMERGDNAVGLNWTCQNCHAEYSGPFIYEHPVTWKHSTQGSGCIECHQPHGSVNDRLLTQPGNGTCLQCHGTPPGHITNHSGLGSKFACIECHSEIHGSYDNRLFLDPDLGTKLFPDCYQSGCHITN